jgi:sugar-specific transcriptional regulator TrmB
MNQLVSELGISFKDIDAKTLAEGFKNADKAIADAKAEYDALLKEQIKVVENSVKLSSNNKRFVESLKSAIKEGKDVKKVQEDITDELQEQINKQKQLKSEAEARKAQAEASKANLGQAEGLRKTGFKSVSTDKDGNTISKNISDEQFTYLKSNFKDIA